MKIALVCIVSALSINAFADGGPLKCGASEEAFYGSVERVSGSNCREDWAIRTSNKTIVPTQLPLAYQKSGARVLGCFHYIENMPPCTLPDGSAVVVDLTSIFFDNP